MITISTSPPSVRRYLPCLGLLVAGGLTGCAGGMAVDGAFAPGEAQGHGFTNILVLGVTPEVNGRCAFEQALAAELRSDTVTATSSCTVMSTKEPITRESVERAVTRVGADAVLATSLVDSTARVKEGGSADARGGGYYKATGIGYDYGYWGAYGVPVVYGEFETAPSVFSISGTARLTTRVFDTRDARLIYTLETTAKDLASREMAVAEISPAIAGRLARDGLVR